MKINGYVYEMNNGEKHFMLDIAGVNLVELICDHLIASASNAMDNNQYKEAEELLHDVNHLTDLLDQYNAATADGDTEQ